MKKLFNLFIFMLAAVAAFSQCTPKTGYSNFTTQGIYTCDTLWSDGYMIQLGDGMCIGDSNKAETALLEVKSTQKGFLMPRMTSAQRDAISLPATGLILYCTSDSNFYYFNSVDWVRIGSSLTGWNLTGNSGTDPSVNFVGTTDAADLVFMRNSQKAGRLAYNNTSYGRGAGVSVTDTDAVLTAVGVRALQVNTSGGENTAVGGYALVTNTTASRNTAVGFGALQSSNSADNTGVGDNALGTLSSGASNTGIGFNSFPSLSTGSNNTAVGNLSGTLLTTGSRNTLIGYGTATASTSTRSAIALGYNATASNNQLAVSDSISQLKLKGLNYTLPTSQTLGVLNNDGSGVLSWGGISGLINTGPGLYIQNDSLFLGGAVQSGWQWDLSDTSLVYYHGGNGNGLWIGQKESGFTDFSLAAVADTVSLIAKENASIIFGQTGENILQGDTSGIFLLCPNKTLFLGDPLGAGGGNGLGISNDADNSIMGLSDNYYFKSKGLAHDVASFQPGEVSIFTNDAHAFFSTTDEVAIGDYDAYASNYYLDIIQGGSAAIYFYLGNKRADFKTISDTIHLRSNAPVIIDSLVLNPDILSYKASFYIATSAYNTGHTAGALVYNELENNTGITFSIDTSNLTGSGFIDIVPSDTNFIKSSTIDKIFTQYTQGFDEPAGYSNIEVRPDEHVIRIWSYDGTTPGPMAEFNGLPSFIDIKKYH